MQLYIQWHQPIILDDGDEENLIYTVANLDVLDEVSGVYMFCRKYSEKYIPLYIGKSINIYKRITQHLNSTKMMRSIQKSLSGEKVLIIGEYTPKSGQDLDKSIKIIEKTLIEHALAEGYELINISGTKTKVHQICFKGFQGAKKFSGPIMYRKE